MSKVLLVKKEFPRELAETDTEQWISWSTQCSEQWISWSKQNNVRVTIHELINPVTNMVQQAAYTDMTPEQLTEFILRFS